MYVEMNFSGFIQQWEVLGSNYKVEFCTSSWLRVWYYRLNFACLREGFGAGGRVYVEMNFAGFILQWEVLGSNYKVEFCTSIWLRVWHNTRH